jgi:hypothetical protein
MIFFSIFFGGFLIVPLLEYARRFLTSKDLFLWIAVAWAAAFLGAALHRSTFPCPRCGRAFFIWYLFGDPTSRKCLHCGLKIGSPYLAGQTSTETGYD